MKKKISILILCSFYLITTAQTFNWAKKAGGSKNDSGKVISTDINKNVYVAGNFTSNSISFGITTLVNSTTTTFTDLFLVKYDSLGNVLWANRYGGISNDNCYGMCLDSSGNIYLTGYFQSPTITFGGTTLTNAGGEDIFVVKFNPSGNALWAKNEGGTGIDEGKSIFCDNSGNIFLTGIFSSPTITIGSSTLTNNGTGNSDIFISKYDSLGNVLFTQGMGGTNSDYVESITIDSSGNIYLTGYFQSNSIIFGSLTLTNSGTTGYPDFYIAKLNPSGSILWANTAGAATGTDTGKNIEVDSNENVIVTGSFSSNTITFGTTTLTNTGPVTRSDIFLVKYDPIGNVLWSVKAGGTSDDEGTDITLDSSGNIYETGFFYSPTITFGSTTLTNSSSTNKADIYIAKYDSSGNVLWAKSAIDGSTDYSLSITSIPGIVYLTGYFMGNTLVLDGVTLSNYALGTQDIFIAKLCDIARPTINASGPTSFCNGDSVTLTAGAGYNSYNWSNGATTQNITVYTSGNYTLTVTNSLGCFSSSSVTVSVISAPTFSVPANSSYCNGVIIPAINFSSVPSGANYTWTNSNTTIGILSSGSANIPSFTAVNTAPSPITSTITVTATLNGCTFSSRSFTITINPSNDASFNYSDSVYCQLDSNPVPSVSTLGGYFISSSNLVFLNASTGQIDLFSSTPNTYIIKHIVGTVCSDTVSKVITIHGNARVNAGNNPVVCSGSSYTLLASISGAASNIIWSTLGTGLFNDSTLLNPIYTPSTADIAAGSVTLTAITDSSVYGCGGAARDTITLTFLNCPNANVETTFLKSYNNGKANSVQQTTDGGFIIAGNCTYSGTMNRWAEISLIKTDANGDTIWTRHFGSTTNTNNNQTSLFDYNGNCVRQTNDGGYIVAGSINIVDSGGTIIDSSEVVLIKTDGLGNILWTKHYGGSGVDQAKSVSQTTDGGYIVVGFTGSFGYGNEDIYLLKVDAIGNILWTKTYGNSSPNFGTNIQNTPDGGFIVSGYEKINNNGYSLACLIKTDNSGNISWAKSYQVSNGYNVAKSVKPTPDGGYIFIGTNRTLVNGSGGGYSTLLIKTDSLGNEMWTKLFAPGWSSGVSFGEDVCVATDGGYFLCGTINSTPYLYPYVSRTNSTGQILYENYISINGVACSNSFLSDGFNSIQQTSDGGVITVGRSITITGTYTCSGISMLKTNDTLYNGCYSDFVLDLEASANSTVNPISPFISSGGTETNYAFNIGRIAFPTISCISSRTVWPGDTDHNTMANNSDLLPIGLYYGYLGSPRSTISNSWQAYPSIDWNIAQPNRQDIKQIDSNGDGIINLDDTLAINLNFNSTHFLTPINTNARTLNPDIYFTTINSTYLPGDIVNVDIMLGTSALPVTNLYGIAFNINYDASLIQPGTETLIYSNSWFATPGTNAIKIAKIDALAATAFGGETRINHTNSNGFGRIATFRFRTKTSISSGSTMNFSYSSYVANDAAGTNLFFNALPYNILIDPTATAIVDDKYSSGITIYPNPFTSQTTLTFNEEQKNSTIKIIDVLGKEIKSFNFSGKQLQIEKGDMKEGIYFLQMIDKNKTVANKRIIIQ